MDANDLSARLSRIKTRLSVWLQAHEGASAAAIEARQQLVLRYYGAVYRYLLSMVRDSVTAEELTQDFAVNVLRGDFKRFDPRRGRFRDFLKAAVRHLALNHWKKRKLQPLEAQPAEMPSTDELDQAFVEKWKEELVAQTWQALEKQESESGQPYYTVLRCKSGAPELPSVQLAERLGAQLGRHVSRDSARQLLHRARRRFAELLVDEVARSLDSAAPDEVTQELIDLGLMSYCRAAVTGHETPS